MSAYVVGCDDDDWFGGGSVRSVVHVKRSLVRTLSEGAAMEEDHNGKRVRGREDRRRRSPDIEVETSFRQVLRDVRVVVSLEAAGTEFSRIEWSRPRCWRLRRLPSVLTARRCRIRNALEVPKLRGQWMRHIQMVRHNHERQTPDTDIRHRHQTQTQPSDTTIRHSHQTQIIGTRVERTDWTVECKECENSEKEVKCDKG